jgi:uncharacterized protein YbjT (DUF2867 family)
MSTVVTGASGHLGRLVVDQLLAAGTSPAQVVATGRDAGKLAGLAQDGVPVRRADFADPSTLDEAFAGADAMLLVSTTTVGERFDNARNAIDAAARAGVPHTGNRAPERSPVTDIHGPRPSFFISRPAVAHFAVDVNDAGAQIREAPIISRNQN